MTQPTYQYLISACLCGQPCRYDGTAQTIDFLAQLVDQGQALMVCPEQLGGLSTPRIPCERLGDRIINQQGNDCTHEFLLGAQKVLKLAQTHNIPQAILKERSPSCGSRQIYDGTFTGNIVAGKGLTAQYLHQNGITVISSDDILAMMQQQE